MFRVPAFIAPFIMNTIDEAGDNGGGSEEQSYDDGLGVPYEAPESQEPTDTGSDQSNLNDEFKVDPNWQKVLDVLPAEFHKQVIPTFKEWDGNFAKVQSEYAPYKPLLENNIPYEQVENSIKLAQSLAADPHALWAELGRRFGFGSEQGQQQVNELEDNEEDNTLDLSEQDDPRIAQLTQTVQQLQQMIEQDHNAKQEAQVRENAQREIDSEWSELETRVGNISPMAKKEIIQRAVLNGDQTGDYSLSKAYGDYAAFVNHVRNTRANNQAPAVLSGNGGLPVTKKNIGQMSEDERIEHIAAMAKALSEGGN